MADKLTAIGYGDGEPRRFPAYRTTNAPTAHSLSTSPSATSAPVVPPTALVAPAMRFVRVKRLLVSLVFFALTGYAGYELWDTFWRYEAIGTVTGHFIGVFGPWDGLVHYTHVTEGESVRQGQLLVTLENTELRRGLARNEDELRVAQADLEAQTSRLKWQSSQQRDIYQESVAVYYKAWGDLTADEAQLGELKIHHERLVGLHKQGLVSSTELDQAAFAVHGQDNKVAKEREALVELRKRIDGGRGMVDNGEEQLKPFLARLSSLQAEHQRLLQQLDEGSIIAPTNGIVVRRHRFTGEFVPHSEPILTLVEEGSQEIVLYLRQPSSKSLAIGDKVSIVVESLHEPLECFVKRIGQEFVSAPDSIKRYYRENEQLLPVYLQPIGRLVVSLGATIKLPRLDNSHTPLVAQAETQ